jgi:crotonobetainyl-CoA:carnitine CoA-transferase CaiB-like acyl-CoA transferase
MEKKKKLPLEGVRVLDLSYVFAVPYMAGLLSDLGAEVIKIEAPHKLDQTRGRAFGPYLDNDPAQDPWNRSGIFYVVNRGKRSLALDLGQEKGQELFRDLVRKSDIVLENYTPRVMRKWGLNYDELKKIKPSLIMLSNTGYGSSGPWSAFPSQGTTLEATMGVTFYTGYEGDKPWKVGQSYPDFIACWAGMNALWAAIVHMRKTGEGQWIDCGMYQLGLSLIPEALIQKQLDGTDRPRIGNEDLEHVPSNLYRASGNDQWIALTVDSDERWAKLAVLMGQAQDIASGPVLNSKDLFINEHLQHRGFYERVEHPAPIGPRPIIGRPYKLRFRDAHIKKPGPRFGEDNDAILRDVLGMTPEQIAELKANKVVCDLPTNPGISGTMDTDMMLSLGTLSAVDKDYRSIMGVDL